MQVYNARTCAMETAITPEHMTAIAIVVAAASQVAQRLESRTCGNQPTHKDLTEAEAIWEAIDMIERELI